MRKIKKIKWSKRKRDKFGVLELHLKGFVKYFCNKYKHQALRRAECWLNRKDGK